MTPRELTDGMTARDQEYRRRILDAAGRLLERNGIASVNMYQIAQEAGVGQGTLYRRYEHPGEIYSELLRTSLQQAVDELEAVSASATGAHLDRLEQVIYRTVDYIDSKLELLSAIHCMYAGKKQTATSKRPLMERLLGLLYCQLSEAAKQGELRHGVDVRLTAQFLLSTFSPGTYQYHRDELGYSKEQYAAGICQLFIEGIRADGEPK